MAKFVCKRCKQTKGVRSFSKDASRPDNRFPWCIACQVEYSTETKFQQPEAKLTGKVCPMDDVPIRGHANRRFCSNTCKTRAKTLLDKYRLTPAQYRSLIPANGRCPICQKKPLRWNVDHNHKTGEILGTVCTNCNVGALASTYHDLEYIARLVEFLSNPPAKALGIEAIYNEKHSAPAQLHRVWNFRRPR